MIYGICIAIVILICILFLPVRAELLYKKEGRLKVSLAGITVYRKTIDRKTSETPNEKVEKADKEAKKLGEKIEDFKNFYKFTTKLLGKYTKLDEITIKIDFGTGDAPSTAVLIGALWGIVYGLIGRIGSICKIKKHNVVINPEFNNTVFSFEGKCIIKSSIAYIIIIAITILMKIKSRKGKHTGVKPNMVLRQTPFEDDK